MVMISCTALRFLSRNPPRYNLGFCRRSRSCIASHSFAFSTSFHTPEARHLNQLRTGIFSQSKEKTSKIHLFSKKYIHAKHFSTSVDIENETNSAPSLQSDDWIEWEKRTLEIKGKERTYYYHPDTRQTIWSHPSEGLVVASGFKRFCAGLLDLTASLGCGTAVGFQMAWELEQLELAQLALVVCMSTFFVLRDGIWEAGTRSFGKRVMCLEIVQVDGQLPARYQCLMRNAIFPACPALVEAAQNPVGKLLWAAFCVDFSRIFSSQGRRIGDLSFGTMVVEQLPERNIRLDYLKAQRQKAQFTRETGEAWIPQIGKLSPKIIPTVSFKEYIQQLKNRLLKKKKSGKD